MCSFCSWIIWEEQDEIKFLLWRDIFPWVFVTKCPYLGTTQFYVHWKWYWNNCNITDSLEFTSTMFPYFQVSMRKVVIQTISYFLLSWMYLFQKTSNKARLSWCIQAYKMSQVSKDEKAKLSNLMMLGNSCGSRHLQIWLIGHIHQTKYLLSNTLQFHYILGNEWNFWYKSEHKKPKSKQNLHSFLSVVSSILCFWKESPILTGGI